MSPLAIMMKYPLIIFVCLCLAHAVLSQDTLFVNALDSSQTLEFDVHELQSPLLTLGALEAGDTVQWYEGASGQTGNPIIGATAAEYAVPNDDIPVVVWARVTQGGSRTDSATFDINFHQAFRPIPVGGAVLKTAGSNGYGTLGIGELDYVPLPVKLADDVVKMASAYMSTYYWKSDGSVWAVGGNTEYALGIGRPDVLFQYEPIQIEGDWIDIFSISPYMNGFIDANHNLYASGNDVTGIFGFSNFDSLRSSPHVVLSDVSQVSVSESSFVHLVYLKTDGTAWGMGSTEAFGTLQMGQDFYFIADDIVELKTSVVYTLLIDGDGQLHGTGTGPGFDSVSEGQPQLVLLHEDVAEIVTAEIDSYIFKDIHGDFFIVTKDELTPVALGTDIAKHYGLFYINDSGELFGKGDNSVGEVGVGTLFKVPDFIKVMDGVESISRSYFSTLMLKTNGELYAAGGKKSLGIDPFVPVGLHAIDSGVMKVDTGAGQILYIKEDDSLWATGLNNRMQLSDTGVSYYDSPGKIRNGVTDVSVDENLLIVDDSGNLLGVGENYGGSLGVGDDEPRTDFTAVLNGTNIRQIQASRSNSIFVKNDNSLWIAGYGSAYKMNAEHDNPSTSTPIKIAEGVVFATVDFSTCYIDEAGDLYVVGGFFNDLKYNGVFYTPGVPYKLASGVVFVSSYQSSIAYILWDGTLWTVGDISSFTPGQVAGENPFKNHVLIDSDVSFVDMVHRLLSYRKKDGTTWMLGNSTAGFGDHFLQAGHTQADQVYHGVDFYAWDIHSGNTAFLCSGLNTPTIIEQPEDVVFEYGAGEYGIGLVTSGDAAQFQWYKGEKGDTSNPVANSNSHMLRVSELFNTSLWVEVTTSAGTILSESGQVTITNPHYQAWANAYSLPVGLASSWVNIDDDIYDNLMEFVFNTDPLGANEMVIEGDIDEVNEEIVFMHVRNPSTEDFLTYKVSTDMRTWSDLPVEVMLEYDAQTKIASIRIPTTVYGVRLFMKVLVARNGLDLP